MSGNYQDPTPLALNYGSNTVTLITGYDTMGNFDLDYLRIDLPAGGRLTNLFLPAFNGDSVSFFGFQAGSAMSFDPEEDNFDCITECIGFSHFGPGASSYGGGVGGDLLAAANIFGPENGGLPFDVPLPDAQYTFWFQEINDAVTYELNFVVSIPGDYNGDSFVNAADYTVWRNTLGQSVVAGEGADGDRNEFVDFEDYLIWKATYGLQVGGGGASLNENGAAVPEPSSLMLLLGGVALVGAFRRKRPKFSTRVNDGN